MILSGKIDIANFYLMPPVSEKKAGFGIFNTCSYKSTSYLITTASSRHISFLKSLIYYSIMSLKTLMLIDFFTDLKSYVTDRESRSSDRKNRSTDRENRSTDRENHFTGRNNRSADRESRYTDRKSRSTDRENRSTDRESRSTDRKNRSTDRKNHFSGRSFQQLVCLVSLINSSKHLFFFPNYSLSLTRYQLKCLTFYWNFSNARPKPVGLILPRALSSKNQF